MPVEVKKRSGLHRIVETNNGRIAVSSKGNPKDGGGHASKERAEAQARAINESSKKKGS